MSQDSRKNFGVKAHISTGVAREGEGKTGAGVKERKESRIKKR